MINMEYKTGDLIKRLVAEIVDEIIIIVGFLFLIFPGLIYVVIQDALFDGRSIGKKLMGLKVINVKTGANCSYKESAIRNLYLAIPILGWLDYIIVLFAEDHRRVGDKLANTVVIGEAESKTSVKAIVLLIIIFLVVMIIGTIMWQIGIFKTT